MLELNIGRDEACFWRLMLERYTAAVSQNALEVMKFAAWGLVGWGAGEILQWCRSGNETKYLVRFRGSASIHWTHLKQFIMYKEYHQDGRWLTWAPVCSVNDWTPVVPVIYVSMNRCGICHTCIGTGSKQTCVLSTPDHTPQHSTAACTRKMTANKKINDGTEAPKIKTITFFFAGKINMINKHDAEITNVKICHDLGVHATIFCV